MVDRGWVNCGGVAASLLVAAVAIVVACAGSSTEVGSPESYADAVCRVWSNHAGQIRRLASGGIDLNEREASKQYALQMAALESGLAQDLGGLEPPAEIAALHRQIVEAHRNGSEAWDSVAKALEQPANEASTAAIDDAMAAVGEALDSEPSLPTEYQQAIQSNERCSGLRDTLPELRQ